MATFNGGQFLTEQLESLASQSFRPFELQVGDDGSTDGTIEILREFAGRAPFPVHVHRNPERLGWAENFIQTALRCSGQWIAFCDQDDVWLPDKLAVCRDVVAGGPSDLGLVVHNATVVDERLQPLGRYYYLPFHLPREGLFDPMELPPEWLAIGMTEIFRADLIRDVATSPRLGFPWREEQDAHDLWVALLANAVGSVFFCDRQLAIYRRHGASMMRDQIGFWARARRRLAGGGRDCRQRAGYLVHAADLLEGRAAATPRPDFRERLMTAAAKIRQQANFLELRAETQAARTFRERSAALTRLVREGGYRGSRGWPFGLVRLARDLAFLIRPRTPDVATDGPARPDRQVSQ